MAAKDGDLDIEGGGGIHHQRAFGHGYRAVVDPGAIHRGFEVLLHIDLNTQEAGVVAAFERAVSQLEEVTEFKRLFGTPDYFVRVAVADLESYEAFLTGRIMPLPGLGKASSHFAMKNILPGAP